MAQVLADCAIKPPLSDDHSSVDGPHLRRLGVYEELPPDGRQRRTSGRNGTRDFHGAKLCNTTPASATDP
jgi:hypothetical protein